MAAFDSGLIAGSTCCPNAAVSTGGGAVGPFPVVIAFTQTAFNAPATLEVIAYGYQAGANYKGTPVNDHITAHAPFQGTFSLFAGVDGYGKNGQFVCKIDPSCMSSGVAIGSGTEGYDQFTGGKRGQMAVTITIPAAKLTTGYIAFVPQDGYQASFVCQLTGTY